MRKLKALGLTISHSPGYELSPRGRALRALRNATWSGRGGRPQFRFILISLADEAARPTFILYAPQPR